jgi:ADP-ribose pyrophosphatase
MDVETIGQGKFLRLVRRGRWEFAERARASGIVVIVPITDSDELLFVEQFRAPLNSSCIEFPAGLAGDLAGASDESLETAARRELLEETGYEAEEVKYLGDGAPSAGLTSEVMSYFEARGLHRVTAGGGVGGENISIKIVPARAVRSWLQEQAGRATISMMVYSGLYLTQH